MNFFRSGWKDGLELSAYSTAARAGWWIVILRHDGEDEDSIYRGQHEHEAAAVAAASTWVDSLVYDETTEDDDRAETYVNAAIYCGAVEPVITSSADVHVGAGR